ncbi:MAG: hypothetical protein WA197_15640 [Candidatus Acidiferrales bacterium]
MSHHGVASIADTPLCARQHPRNRTSQRLIPNRNNTSFKNPVNPMKTNPKLKSNRNKKAIPPLFASCESQFTNVPRRQAGHRSRITNHASPRRSP